MDWFKHSCLLMAKYVAIIGAGASGLAATKCCLDEGLEPVWFERSGYIGGVWHFTREDVPDTSTVMLDTIAMNSKEMMSFSDFPAPREFPIYMHNTHVDKYLNLYSERFDLSKHVRLKHEVLSVREAPDHDMTGRWMVTARDIESETTTAHIVDGVFVCTGALRRPYSPHIAGLDVFQSTVMHANQYKDSSDFKGKRVVVVGFGNSGADIATDLCNNADQIFLSARNGGWLVNKYWLELGLSRISVVLAPVFPKILNKLIARCLNQIFDHQKYQLNPKDLPLKSNVVVSDTLQKYLVNGEVQMKPAISCFRSTNVEFVDGSDVSNIDVVIMATGYKIVYKFLDSNVIGEDKTKLYKAMYPPERRQHTLAFLDCFRLQGPVFPVVELQARVATRVLKGLIKLPQTGRMLQDIQQRKAKTAATKNPRMLDIIQVDYFPYMDELARMIGCKPNIYIRLATRCIFGPVTSYQFRLQGPGSWSGAREAIMTTEDRTLYPQNEKGPNEPADDRSYSFGSHMVFVSVTIALCLCFALIF